MNKMMLLIFNYTIFMFIIIMTISIMTFKLTKKLTIKNNMMNFECGFNNMNIKRIPMFKNFIFIMIIFIMFDLEIMILIPMFTTKNYSNWLMNIFMLMKLMSLIMISMIYEIKLNLITWKY